MWELTLRSIASGTNAVLNYGKLGFSSHCLSGIDPEHCRCLSLLRESRRPRCEEGEGQRWVTAGTRSQARSENIQLRTKPASLCPPLLPSSLPSFSLHSPLLPCSFYFFSFMAIASIDYLLCTSLDVDVGKILITKCI